MSKLFFIPLSLIILTFTLKGSEISLTSGEKRFLEEARQRDYIGKQAHGELLMRPEAFFTGLLKREELLAREQLEKSLENAWQVRDDFEMQELFFQLLERELADH